MESLPVEMRRMIMDHLTNAELVTISLVNKQFNCEARTLAQARGNFIAHLDCENVLPFLSHMKDMSVVPFSGIKINFSDTYHRNVCQRPHKKLDPSVLQVLGQMPLKHLSLRFNGGRYVPKRCPVIQTLKKILQDYSGALEELEVTNHSKYFEFIRDIIQDSTFPRLKITKLSGLRGRTIHGEGIQVFLIDEFKARAPNLEEVYL